MPPTGMQHRLVLLVILRIIQTMDRKRAPQAALEQVDNLLEVVQRQKIVALQGIVQPITHVRPMSVFQTAVRLDRDQLIILLDIL